MPRFVLIRSARDIDLAILAAAGLDCRIDVVSAPDAGIRAGALWWKALVDGHADSVGVALLDCGDSPGRTMGAFRAGVRDVLFRGSDALAAPLAQIAEAQGARLWREAPEALDLDRARDAEAACRAWLAGEAPARPGPRPLPRLRN
ncbi:MAG TPA: hypothetical protein VFO41_09985 [Alphaproteobacteria bacterium]|nr:hypothetical protein [Alphaproteobacteria bacterium]